MAFTKNHWVTYFEPNLILSLQTTFCLLTSFILRSISIGDTGKPASKGRVLWWLWVIRCANLKCNFNQKLNVQDRDKWRQWNSVAQNQGLPLFLSTHWLLAENFSQYGRMFSASQDITYLDRKTHMVTLSPPSTQRSCPKNSPGTFQGNYSEN